MLIKRGWIYDGKNRLELVIGFGGLILKSPVGRVNSTSAEREVISWIDDKIEISEGVYICNYREVGFLSVRGKIKPLDDTIWKYIEEESDLPEL